MTKKYDYLIVGAGLFGAVFTSLAIEKGKRVLVVDRRNEIGGNVYTENIEGINVHKYGAHIFHTNFEDVWSYVNEFCEFLPFINSPIAKYKDKTYNLPFNMNTFKQMFGTETPDEAKSFIEKEVENEHIIEVKNLEDKALSLVGRTLYETLIKGYTEKQWGRDAKDLPPFIIARVPLRFTYDNSYFNDKYQGVPKGGYSTMIRRMLLGANVILDTDYLKDKEYFDSIADKVVFTGSIDEYFGYKLGKLQYRSLKFDEKVLDTENFQNNAVVNYTERDVPYTRIIEHKHFEHAVSPKTVVTYEYPDEWDDTKERFYPINDEKNNRLYNEYLTLAQGLQNVYFKGRLGEYKYFDMDDVVKSALDFAKSVL